MTGSDRESMKLYITLVCSLNISLVYMLAVLAQMVAYLPLVQQVRGPIPGGVSKFSFENFPPRR